MNKEELLELFTILCNEYDQSEKSYYRLVRNNKFYSLHLGVDEQKRPLFMIQANEGNNITINSCKGFHVESIFSDSCFRCVIQSIQEYRDMFFVIIADLVSFEPENSGREIFERLIHWMEFFSRTDKGRMSFEKQIGLFGELLFIHKYQELDFPEIIMGWDGPSRAPKDFNYPRCSVEVKALRVKDRNHVRISSLEQLANEGTKPLFLCSFVLGENPMDGTTLPELIDSIISDIEDERLRNIFTDKLMMAGYRSEFAEYYTTRWNLENTLLYKVEEGFPRLVKENLATGIINVAYELDLACCQNFYVKDSVLNSLIF